MMNEVRGALICLYLTQNSLPTRKELIQTINTKLALGMISIVKPSEYYQQLDRTFIGDGITFIKMYTKSRCNNIVSSTPLKRADSNIFLNQPLLYMDLPPIPRSKCVRKLDFNSNEIDVFDQFTTCLALNDFENDWM